MKKVRVHCVHRGILELMWFLKKYMFRVTFYMTNR